VRTIIKCTRCGRHSRNRDIFKMPSDTVVLCADCQSDFLRTYLGHIYGTNLQQRLVGWAREKDFPLNTELHAAARRVVNFLCETNQLKPESLLAGTLPAIITGEYQLVAEAIIAAIRTSTGKPYYPATEKLLTAFDVCISGDTK